MVDLVVDRDIPEEMVEKAARGLARPAGWPSDNTPGAERVRQAYRDDARRALSAALEGCAVVQLPEPDGTSYEGDPIWGAHVDYEDIIFACVYDGHAVVDGPIGDEPLPADVAEMFGLRLLAAAREARRLASGSGVGDQQHPDTTTLTEETS